MTRLVTAPAVSLVCELDPEAEPMELLIRLIIDKLLFSVFLGFVFSLVYLFFMCVCVFLTWLQNPPCFFVFVFWFVLFVFVSFLAFRRRKACSPPPKKASLHIFQCLSLFLLCFSWLPRLALSLYVYINIYISLSLYFFPFCLPSLFVVFLNFILFCCCLFSLPCLFAFPSWKEQGQNIKLERFSSSVLSVCWFLVLFVFQILFFLVFIFLILSCVFVQHQRFCLQKMTT